MWQWSPCMMMACAPYDGGCPACDPAGSCVPVSPPPQSHCQGLNERLCNETPGCLGVYDGPCSTCPDPANCFCSSAFDHCTDDAFCGSGSGNTCSGSTGGGTAVDGGPAPTGP